MYFLFLKSKDEDRGDFIPTTPDKRVCTCLKLLRRFFQKAREIAVYRNGFGTESQGLSL